MFARLSTWLDQRTGYRKLMQVMLLEHIPGGAKWRYVWGSCLAFVFMLQLVTGVLLMTAYSPGNSTAWGSVYFIQYEMEFGWLIRGLHHFGSQTMVVLLGIHMLQVVIAGAHLAPREINWWLGLALMGLILAMSLTGYLLPWDQKGYWATQVATSIAGSLPGVGSFVRRVVVGGPEYGHATLSRFYALHVSILPALLLVLLVAHIAIFRRHGVAAPKDAKGEGLFWPDQAFRDMIACLAVFGIMLALVVFGGHGHAIDSAAFANQAPAAAEAAKNGEAAPPPAAPAEAGPWQRLALGGRDGGGANLDAPADPGSSYPARPEWYFLFLFQLLKYFKGEQMILGTVIIPNGVGVLLFLLPFFGYGRLRPLGHALGVLVVVALLAAVSSLTCLALADDTADPVRRQVLTLLAIPIIPAVGGFFLLYLALLGILRKGGARKFVSVTGGLIALVLLAGVGAGIYGARSGQLPEQVTSRIDVDRTSEKEKQTQEKIATFEHQVEQADEHAGRAVELATAGIPAEGAVLLLQRDPKTQGPKLFKQYCAVCHSYNLKDNGVDDFHDAKDNAKFHAGDLAGFGTEGGILSLLKDPDGPRYFGHTPFNGGAMSDAVANAQAQDKNAEVNFTRIAAWLATHPQEPPKKTDPEGHLQAYKVFTDAKVYRCQSCHSFAGVGGSATNRGPDLTGYGGQAWLHMMITDPHDLLRYGRTGKKRPLNAMPLFRDKESVTWDVQRLQIERQRDALLKALLQQVPEENLKSEAALVVGALAAPLPQNLVVLDELMSRIKQRPEARKAQEAAVHKANDIARQKVALATEVIGLTEVERELIVRWLTGDHRVVFGGSPIRAPGKR